MNTNSRYQHLLLLVGSNPLPNYLAAMALQPTTIHFLFTSATEEPKNRLYEALKADLSLADTAFNDVFINDSTDANEIDQKVASISSNIHLHYSGGTKVMAAHALKAFYQYNGKPNNASYLDEINTRLRFDDGGENKLDEYDWKLKLDRILQLHSVTGKPRSSMDGEPTTEDTKVIAKAICKNSEFASDLYQQRKEKLENPKKAESEPFVPAQYDLNLSVSPLPGPSHSKKLFECWYKYIGGEWLEYWMANLINSLKLEKTEVYTGVKCSRGNRDFEVDVVAIRGQRSYYISCTTESKDLYRCKSKAFEIAARSRQMGGDLARSAIVCLLEGNKIGQLRLDVSDVWKASNTPRVFGLEDIQQWSGHFDRVDLSLLRDWLNS